MNHVVLMGRLTKDPDIRYSQEGMCIGRYTLAVDRRRKSDGNNEADFISCVAFGKNGEFAEKYLNKGTKIAIEGHIQTGNFTDKDGKKVYTTDVIVDRQEFCESRKDNSSNSSNEGFADIPEGFDNIPDIDSAELPF